MAATLRHFAINADNVQRAKAFYEAAFGWNFQPWGPPDFYQVTNAGTGGALQGRREIVPGVPMRGVEATMSVDDLPATIAAVEAAGGKIVGGPYRIGGVGELVWFEDTEGNLLGAMKYEAHVA
jgi:predicted enzyme related to lactoylglutathione lyase